MQSRKTAKNKKSFPKKMNYSINFSSLFCADWKLRMLYLYQNIHLFNKLSCFFIYLGIFGRKCLNNNKNYNKTSECFYMEITNV